MMRRRIIGRFKRSKQGGWEGEISTLAIQRQIRLVPNDDRVSDRAPSFRLMLGWHHIGDAWERTSHSEPPREYLRVRIDDPAWPQPLWGAMMESTDDGGVRLLWRRDKPEGA